MISERFLLSRQTQFSLHKFFVEEIRGRKPHAIIVVNAILPRYDVHSTPMDIEKRMNDTKRKGRICWATEIMKWENLTLGIDLTD